MPARMLMQDASPLHAGKMYLFALYLPLACACDIALGRGSMVTHGVMHDHEHNVVCAECVHARRADDHMSRSTVYAVCVVCMFSWAHARRDV